MRLESFCLEATNFMEIFVTSFFIFNHSTITLPGTIMRSPAQSYQWGTCCICSIALCVMLQIFLLSIYYLKLMLDKHAFACFFLSPCVSLSYAAHVLSICQQHVSHTCLLLMHSSLSTYLSPYVHHTLSMPMPRFLTVYIVAYRVVYTSASLCFLITRSLLAQYSNETLWSKLLMNMTVDD